MSLLYGVAKNDADYNVTKMSGGRRVWTCPYYSRWQSMIKRCYCKKELERFPTYKEVKVCEEWLIFSNFKRWMENQDWIGKELDKDILSNGDKIYSPETCRFVDKQKNIEVARSKHYKFKSPEGEIFKVFNLNKFCRENSLTSTQMYNVALKKRAQHKGWTLA